MLHCSFKCSNLLFCTFSFAWLSGRSLISRGETLNLHLEVEWVYCVRVTQYTHGLMFPSVSLCPLALMIPYLVLRRQVGTAALMLVLCVSPITPRSFKWIGEGPRLSSNLRTRWEEKTLSGKVISVCGGLLLIEIHKNVWRAFTSTNKSCP